MSAESRKTANKKGNKMNYRFTVQPTHDVGSYSGRCSSRADALSDYNSCRAHDGLPPLRRLPDGTQYTPLVEYVLQGNYGHGWDDLTSHDTRRDAIAEARVYRENECAGFRIVRRSV